MAHRLHGRVNSNLRKDCYLTRFCPTARGLRHRCARRHQAGAAQTIGPVQTAAATVIVYAGAAARGPDVDQMARELT
jgi:hypothetical protein